MFSLSLFLPPFLPCLSIKPSLDLELLLQLVIVGRQRVLMLEELRQAVDLELIPLDVLLTLEPCPLTI